MPSSSSSAKRAAAPEGAPLKSKQREIDEAKQQALTTMNINSSSSANNSGNKLATSSSQNYQDYQQQQQRQTLSPAAAMMTNYQQRYHNNYELGSQTISRSNNLHKQYPRAASAYAQQQALAAAAASGGYYFYDQPNYQSAHLYLNPQQQQQHYQQRVPYAPMSLALRPTKQRPAIPLGPLMAAGYPPVMASGHLSRTLGRPSSCHLKQSQGAKDFAPATMGPLQAANLQHLTSAGRLIYQEPTLNLLNAHPDQHHQLQHQHQARLNNKPLCRCRVMYLGSSVPHITKNGLHGIQEPLRHLYPEEQFNTSNLRTTTRSKSSAATGPSSSGGAASIGPAQTKISNTIDISHLS